MEEKKKIEISNGTGGSIDVMCPYGDIHENCPVYQFLKSSPRCDGYDDLKLSVRIHGNTDYVNKLINEAKKNCSPKCNTGR